MTLVSKPLHKAIQPVGSKWIQKANTTRKEQSCIRNGANGLRSAMYKMLSAQTRSLYLFAFLQGKMGYKVNLMRRFRHLYVDMLRNCSVSSAFPTGVWVYPTSPSTMRRMRPQQHNLSDQIVFNVCPDLLKKTKRQKENWH